MKTFSAGRDEPQILTNKKGAHKLQHHVVLQVQQLTLSPSSNTTDKNQRAVTSWILASPPSVIFSTGHRIFATCCQRLQTLE